MTAGAIQRFYENEGGIKNRYNKIGAQSMLNLLLKRASKFEKYEKQKIQDPRRIECFFRPLRD